MKGDDEDRRKYGLADRPKMKQSEFAIKNEQQIARGRGETALDTNWNGLRDSKAKIPLCGKKFHTIKTLLGFRFFLTLNASKNKQDSIREESKQST